MERILKLVEIEHTERDNNPPPSLTGCLTGCQEGLFEEHWKYLHTKHTSTAFFRIKRSGTPFIRGQAARGLVGIPAWKGADTSLLLSFQHLGGCCINFHSVPADVLC